MTPNNSLDEKEILAQINQYSSTKLAEMIVAHRYLGISDTICIAAMQELGARRAAGEDFDFETFIKENSQTLPKLDIKVPAMDLGALLQMLKGMK
jgi:hypothetical protein